VQLAALVRAVPLALVRLAALARAVPQVPRVQVPLAR